MDWKCKSEKKWLKKICGIKERKEGKERHKRKERLVEDEGWIGKGIKQRRKICDKERRNAMIWC